MTEYISPDINSSDTTEPQYVQSGFQKLYDELGVSSPLELSNKFTEIDQAAMHSKSYDYDDNTTELNILKSKIEMLDPGTLNEEENDWRNEMLWLWNHHAAGFALFGKKDRERALDFAKTALDNQSEDHPNRITELIYLLARGDLEAAEAWARDEVGEVEQAAAEDAIKMYKEHVLS